VSFDSKHFFNISLRYERLVVLALKRVERRIAIVERLKFPPTVDPFVTGLHILLGWLFTLRKIEIPQS